MGKKVKDFLRFKSITVIGNNFTIEIDCKKDKSKLKEYLDMEIKYWKEFGLNAVIYV